MSQIYSIKEILKAVDNINPEELSSKKFAKEEILEAINEINKKKTSKEILKYTLNIKKNDIIPSIKRIDSKITNKKVSKVHNDFTEPLLLTNIIKYEPRDTKILFLKKLYNTNIKIIAMKASGEKK